MLASLDVGRRQVQLEGFNWLKRVLKWLWFCAKINDNLNSVNMMFLTVKDFVSNKFRQTGPQRILYQT
jgi:hypothetical protein